MSNQSDDLEATKLNMEAMDSIDSIIHNDPLVEKLGAARCYQQLPAWKTDFITAYILVVGSNAVVNNAAVFENPIDNELSAKLKKAEDALREVVACFAE